MLYDKKKSEVDDLGRCMVTEKQGLGTFYTPSPRPLLPLHPTIPRRGDITERGLEREGVIKWILRYSKPYRVTPEHRGRDIEGEKELLSGF